MGSEKEEFRNLNEKLACYIERVRVSGAGASPATLKLLLKELEDEAARQRIFYEREIEKLRLQVDEATRAKNAVESESENQLRTIASYKARYEEESRKNEERLDELTKANKRIIELEQEVAELRASAKGPQDRLLQVQGDIGKAMQKYDAANNELMKEREKVKNLQCQLNSTMQKTDFSKRSFEEQLKESNSRLEKAKKLIIDLETQNKALESKNASIPGLMEQMRRKNDEDIRAYKEQNEFNSTRNMSELKRQLDALSSQVDKLRTENCTLQSDNDEAKTWMKAMELRSSDLQAQKDTLEAQLKAERERNRQQLKESESRLKELQALVMEKMQESNESRDIQASLRAELETYRMLLDEEDGKFGQCEHNHVPKGSLRSQGSGANRFPKTSNSMNGMVNTGNGGRFGSASSNKNNSTGKKILLRSMTTTYRDSYTPKFNSFTSSWDSRRGKKGELPRVE